MSLVIPDQLTAPAQPSAPPTAAAMYAALLDTIGEGVIFTDLAGRIRFWNSGATKIFGYRADEMLGRTPAVLYPTESAERLADDLDRILAGQDFVGEWRGRRKDGTSVCIEVRTTVVRDRSGSPIGFLGVSKDVTDRKSAEATLLRQEILEAVARLAGGVAHEANNQMSVILGLASFALARTDLPDSLRPDLTRIKSAAQHTATITRQLLAFSRRQLLEPRVLDLNAAIQAFRPVLGEILGDGIELQLDLSPELPPVEIDERQLHLALQTLAENARDSMTAGGRLMLETRKRVVRERWMPARDVSVEPGTYVELAVRDTGAGMDRHTLTHLFEPFFTTKDVGSGTGLGLASVYGIVKQSGGYVFAESSPGQGACFRILFPATSGASS
jgi:two-component system, cell cycle sensor histidine kinase and response regulator CckA